MPGQCSLSVICSAGRELWPCQVQREDLLRRAQSCGEPLPGEQVADLEESCVLESHESTVN